MINPILLEPSPCFSDALWTVFVLDLCLNGDDYSTIRTTLEEIDPEMLLFTRRLKQIEILLRPEDHVDYKGVVKSNVYRITLYDVFPGVYAIQRNASAELKTCDLLHEMHVRNMPKHLSGPDVTESHIVLAFPFNELDGPVIDNQQMFAFMPVHETSLQVNSVLLCGTHFSVFDPGRLSHTNKQRRIT
jgi:hypothetical protein